MTSQQGEDTSVYNFSCAQSCSRWVLYLLDYATPLQGCGYKLPCVVDSKSVQKNSTTARKELDLKAGNGGLSITAKTGKLMLVAHCIGADGTLYANGVMVRVGKARACTNAMRACTRTGRCTPIYTDISCTCVDVT